MELSYGKLHAMARAIASRLVEAGVRDDVIVVILAERSFNLLAAMIGVQQAGGAFLPLDPTLPAIRLGQIIEHSATPLVLVTKSCTPLAQKALSGAPTDARPRIMGLEEMVQTRALDCRLPFRSRPASLAYVIYTSGSTGAPKGAMVEQRGMLNDLVSLTRDLRLSAADVIAHTSPQSFVISVWQFLTPLLVGGKVHICRDEAIRDPALLVREIAHAGVTVLQIVPTMLRAILDLTPSDPAFGALRQLRWLISTGEALPPDLCRGWFRYLANVPLVDAYGATECSDDVARQIMTAPPASTGSLPIGRAIANMSLFVLDRRLQPVPIGVIGELYVGGVGVGRGYLNDAAQTRRSFLPNPFASRRGARLYRTGDLARWRADGMLEFLGRVDQQVKVRGYRVELNEIEHVLTEHPEVGAAIVLKRDDLGEEPQLIAHVVTKSSRRPLVNELRDFLKSRVPSYMLPAGFIFMERLPLTPHGKVDRRALLNLDKGLELEGSAFVAPRNSTEKDLAKIWSDLLGRDRIGVFDNFFDLGGHSLLANRVLSRIKHAIGVDLPIRAMFEAARIAALAERVNAASQSPSNTPVPEILRR